MQHPKTISKVFALFATLSLFLFFGCEPEPEVEVLNNQNTISVDERAKTPIDPGSIPDLSNAMANGNNTFPNFYKGFNHDTYPWADQSNPGPTGWCGTIEQHDKNSGPVKPSKGNGYATVEQGPCNDYWSAILPAPFGAPANTLDFGLFSSTWPASGFIQKLDIYLDPSDYNDGLAFQYSNSLNALYSTVLPFDFYYFSIAVNKTPGGALNVAGHDVADEGWYTFRYVFDSDASGMLTVDFQIIENGQPLHTKSIDNTFFGIPTSSLAVSELGSGYFWFVSIADEVELPIDEQHVHPGGGNSE